MASRYLLHLYALTAIGAGMNLAHAQPVTFACPRAGVIEERGLGSLQYTGPAPNDPFV